MRTILMPKRSRAEIARGTMDQNGARLMTFQVARLFAGVEQGSSPSLKHLTSYFRSGRADWRLLECGRGLHLYQNGIVDDNYQHDD